METNLITKAKELRRVAERLAYFQDDGEYSYIDKYKEVLSWIYKACRELIRFHGESDEEEAEICLSVLIGYSYYRAQCQKHSARRQSCLYGASAFGFFGIEVPVVGILLCRRSRSKVDGPGQTDYADMDGQSIIRRRSSY